MSALDLSKLLFKQRMFSWFDTYDVYDATGQRAFIVKGQLSWGHKLNIYDDQGRYVGTVKETPISLLPRFEVQIGERYAGCIKRKFNLSRPEYEVEFMGWQVNGDIVGWDYTVTDHCGEIVAVIGKEIFNAGDTYSIRLNNPANAIYALALTIALEAEKYSGNDGFH